MIKKKDYNVVLKNIHKNIVNLAENSIESKLTASEILPVVVAPILYLDFNTLKPDAKNVFRLVQKRMNMGKLNFYQYDFDATCVALETSWIGDKPEYESRQLLLEFKIIRGFDHDGNAIFDEMRFNKWVKVSIDPMSEIRYGVQKEYGRGKSKSYGIVENEALLHGHQIYLWKLRQEDCQLALTEKDLKCVQNNSAVPFDISSFSSYTDYLSACNFSLKKRKGSVVYAWWEFGKLLKKDDYVLLYDNQHDVVVSVGIIGEYRFEESMDELRSRRSVRWLPFKPCDSPHQYREGGIWARIITNPDVTVLFEPLIEKALKNSHEA